jgi:hypothetical protein
MRELAHLVEMHSKYAGKDLVVVTVHLYTPEDDAEGRKKAEEGALKFLQKIKANFTNLALDAPYDFWEPKLGEGNVPITYVFNRRNQIEAKYTDEKEAVAGLDKLVPELLQP